MKILSIGQFSADGMSNTCLHRNWALNKIASVTEIDSTLCHTPYLYRVINCLFVKCRLPLKFDNGDLNTQIRQMVDSKNFDCIWIDKGIFVGRKTLLHIKKTQPSAVIIGYSPDNMAKRHNQSQHFIESLPLYDYYVTTKSYIVDDLKRMGAKNVIFVNNAYEETFHHPYDITQEEKKRLGGCVGFVGSWEEERFLSMKYLAEHGVPVRVWGGGKWKEYVGKIPNLIVEGKGLFSEDYNKAISAFDISLCFLRKMNFDQQTTRTMEIPACQSLLMAERTDEHESLFLDGKEAVFFSSDEELLEKCKHYIAHPYECKQISKAGRQKCLSAGYSNEAMIRSVLIKTGLL